MSKLSLFNPVDTTKHEEASEAKPKQPTQKTV